VRSGADGIAHVMQAVEKRDEVVGSRIGLGLRDLEARVGAGPRFGSRRARSIEPAWLSKPVNCEFGKARAMTMVEAPCPQPTSATRAPRSSFSMTPCS
jgi:hypothetical protein